MTLGSVPRANSVSERVLSHHQIDKETVFQMKESFFRRGHSTDSALLRLAVVKRPMSMVKVFSLTTPFYSFKNE